MVWLFFAIVVIIGAWLSRHQIVDSWHTLQKFPPEGAALIAGIAVLHSCIGTIATVFTLPDLKLHRAILVGLFSGSVTNIASGAVGTGTKAAVLRSWGYEPRDIATSLAVTGIWANILKICVGFVALGLTANSTIVLLLACVAAAATLIGTILFVHSQRIAWVLGSVAEWLFGKIMRLFKKPKPSGWKEVIDDIREHVIDIAKKKWHYLTVFTALAYVSQFLVLLAALRVSGIDGATVSSLEAFAAFSVMRVANFGVTPGGVGVVETTLAAMLTAYGADAGDALLSIVAFRSATWLLPIVVGVPTWGIWQVEHSVHTKVSNKLKRKKRSAISENVKELKEVEAPIDTIEGCVEAKHYTNPSSNPVSSLHEL